MTPPAAASAAQLRWRRQPASCLSIEPDLAAAWDRLNAQRGDLPFLVADAVASAIEVFGGGREVLFVGRDAAASGEPVVALCVLVPSGLLQWQSFQPSQLPLGAWVAAAAYDWADLADSLLQQALPAALMLSLTRLDPDVAPRPPARARQRQVDYIETAWLAIEGSLEAYWAERGKNLRQNMRKQRNRLAADGVSLQMRTLSDVGEMAGALERYGQLESAGWKADEGSAVRADNAQGRFYRRLIEGAARRGEARVYEYRFDERTVAVNLCLLRAGVLVILKTTYDESIKAFSPAFLLHQDMVEALFTSGEAHRIEYFGSLMEWHTKWTGRSRVLYHLTVYRWGWLQRAVLAWRACSAAAAPTTAIPPASPPRAP